MDIYVGNLSFDASEDDVRNAFTQFGNVESIKLITDREAGRPRGFGFVTMPDSSEANAAIESLNGTELLGRELRIREGNPTPRTPETRWRGRLPRRRRRAGASAAVAVVSAAEAEAAKAPDAATGASNRTDSKGFKNKVFPTDEPRLKTARFFYSSFSFRVSTTFNSPVVPPGPANVLTLPKSPSKFVPK